MMDEGKITFLGLGDCTVFTGRRVWTFNDWYRRHAWMPNPERVYNIHEDFDGKHPVNSSRFLCWREMYEASKAEIVTISNLGFSRQRLIDYEYLFSRFGKEHFINSLSYMFAEAICEGAREIKLEGVELPAGDHEWQIPGVCWWLSQCRAEGMTVIAENEKIWLTVDWASLPNHGVSGYGLKAR